MQKIVFLLLFVFSGITSFSQQDFFVYLQTDNYQPFYARISTKIYSSTDNGYMIIPKLGDSVYQVIIGFAKNAFPEQTFSVAINKKDKGFQLKNMGEKGWALVNLQNMAVITSTGIPLKMASELSGIRKTDAFSEMLANVVNDSAILYSAVKAKLPESAPEKKALGIIDPIVKNNQDKDSIKTSIAINRPADEELVKQVDSPSKPGDALTKSKVNTMEAQANTNKSINPEIKDPESSKIIDSGLAQKAITEKPFLTKIEEKKADGLYQATYLEQYNFVTDTIKISIPLNEGLSQNTTSITEKKPEPIPDQKNVPEERTPPVKLIVTDTASSVKKAIPITNSDCKSLATDYDVDKLRVKLINDKTIDDRLATAKKYFKNKCLSVKQIKALTELFPSDETKYRFFDISYPFISDTDNFYTLEELIEANYYKTRFKAMIQK
jgi:hypothetical protein